MKGIFVTANDTNVGKTWVGSQLLKELVRQQITVQARKPVESGWPSQADVSETDAWKIANAINQTDKLDVICPNRFLAALSPDRAAMLEGKKISLKELHQACTKEVNKADFLFVEGAGGFYSPICDDGLNADLASSLKLPVLLVVEDRLGCINQALLTAEAIKKQGLSLCAIVLNQVNSSQQDVDMDNFSAIQKRVDCELIRFGYKQVAKDSIEKLAKVVLSA